MRNFENGHKIKNFEIACSYMEKVFYSLFHPQKSSALLREQEWHPFTNVYELASEILIEIELAGIKESDVQINFKENYLIIKGTRKERRGAQIFFIIKWKWNMGHLRELFTFHLKLTLKKFTEYMKMVF